MPTKDAIDETKVKVCEACCCYYSGCMSDTCPIGCACTETCCCLNGEACCKNMEEGSSKPACFCCEITCQSPTTCCKTEQQTCCCVAACAFPPDEEVPCMIAECCIMCYPTDSMGVCKTVGDVRAGGTAEPPASEKL